MDILLQHLRDLTLGSRLGLILVLALLAHLLVLALRRVGRWILAPDVPSRTLARRRPKLATVTTLIVSTLTFAIYFTAAGIALGEMGVSLTAYFASATVIGLAIGFGSQGLVQDIVIGLTLIFSDVIDVGDVVDIGGQTGRVESIGLRFTVLRTLLDQHVFIPNRNVGQINRYRNGYIRAWTDVQVPDAVPEERLVAIIRSVGEGMAAQHRGVLLSEPDVVGVRDAAAPKEGEDTAAAGTPGDAGRPAEEPDSPSGWRYVRVKFRLWPGQGTLVETTFRQRVLAAIRREEPDYPDWKVVVTYRTER